ncbi:MAG: hypothetical protein QOH46_3320 [Solirubrobacteraceae bacterium]|jgi:hypothetical protein|nr:hypothetical protein [Solirubrobacteraceae bacterium]
MSDMAMDRRGDGDAGEAKGAAATAIFLWIVVLAGLAYGLINTLRTVVDLFSG